MIANPLERYAVRMVPSDEINPSPENDEIYGPIVHDDQMVALIESIDDNGLAEPILLTTDGWILSGHRRFYASQCLEWSEVPVKVHPTICRENCDDYHRKLTEYNPQRVKTVGATLREALLRDQSADDTYAAIREHHEARCRVDVDFMDVLGEKTTRPISGAKADFLRAAQKIVNGMRDYWPLSIRQIHYNLLNDPPLTQTPKDSRYSAEHFRYRNDKSSYTKLVRLLGPARKNGQIPMESIDDATRPQVYHRGFDNVSHFVQTEVENFLSGYHRDRQADQPRHIEILGEKNTLMVMLKRVASEYHIPLSLARGFCSLPVWRNMSERFRRSGKESMVLLIVSDFDPEGLELADDAIRSLRQAPWNIPVEGHRVAVERYQVDELGLAADFNAAKPTSSRFKSFVSRTGSDQSWECESLPPDYLIEQLKAAVEANLDMETFRKVLEQERSDCDELLAIKRQIAGELEF
ncbi:ParB N-terminal domain-containing protein [Blastopirellula marina]|nr:ParB N-terminal domain-containing protein [Blastopirellula marina]